MAFEGLEGPIFAILLTALIFATLIAILCCIRRREARRAQLAEREAHMLPPPPAPYGLNLPRLSTNPEFDYSGENLVAVPVSEQ